MRFKLFQSNFVDLDDLRNLSFVLQIKFVREKLIKKHRKCIIIQKYANQRVVIRRLMLNSVTSYVLSLLIMNNWICAWTLIWFQCPVPTPPGSNKPAGLPEDTALLGKTRMAGAGTGAHPSPAGLTGGGVNILASAELSKMFPTPPSHEHPMQSPCGQLEGSVDAQGDLSTGGSQNGVKSEPGLNGCSPTYTQEDANKVRSAH